MALGVLADILFECDSIKAANETMTAKCSLKWGKGEGIKIIFDTLTVVNISLLCLRQ